MVLSDIALLNCLELFIESRGPKVAKLEKREKNIRKNLGWENYALGMVFVMV